jgi:Flp pilus assembly pilin Flp
MVLLAKSRRRILECLAVLRADTRGAILVEYSALIGGVAIAGAVGLVLVGAEVARSLDFVRSMILCPIP